VATIAVLAAAALIGLGIGVGPHLFSSDAGASKEFDTQHSVRTLKLPGHGSDLSAAEVAHRFANPRRPIAPAAPDARTAVERFLRGEITRDDRLAYAQLSAADRYTYPTVSTWTHHEAESAQLLTAAITSIVQDRDAADVNVQLHQHASLDEIQGLVPADAHARFHVAREDGGWRVDLLDSRVVADYPSDRSAPAAAVAWAESRVSCAKTPKFQWRAGLYGDGADLVAAQLCDRKGAVHVDGVRPLNDNDSYSALLAAFGPDVGLWARVVPLRAPSAMNLVLAPVGEQWLVIGMLSSSPDGGQG
jgi:hypothetical protein